MTVAVGRVSNYTATLSASDMVAEEQVIRRQLGLR